MDLGLIGLRYVVLLTDAFAARDCRGARFRRVRLDRRLTALARARAHAGRLRFTGRSIGDR